MLTQEQRETRQTGLGGSEAAAIVGASTYATPYQIYCDKISPLKDYVMTPQQERGHILEPLVRKLYEIKTGHQVTVPKDTVRHEKHPFMLGHIDGYVKSEDTLCEFKTTNSFQSKQWGDEGSDYIPLSYRIQCAHYAPILEAKRVDIGLLIGSDDFLNLLVKVVDKIDPYEIPDKNFRIYHQYRSPAIEKRLIEREGGFWNDHVVKRIPPQAHTQEDVLSMFSQTDNSTLIAKMDDLDLIDRMNTLKCNIKKVEEEFTSLKTKICAQMGLSSVIADETGNQLLTWKNQKAFRFDTALFKDQHPELYQKFCKASETRVLRLH